MRLIDADEFCRYTDEHCQDGFADLWKELIRRQPTAFDKEKVMGDMYLIGRKYCENVSCEEECDDCDHGVLMNSLIKIVEKGGIE